MKTFVKTLVAGLAGLVCSVALATATFVPFGAYVGYSPVAGTNGEPGVNIAAGGRQYAVTSNTTGTAVPALVVTGTNCAATVPAIGGTLGKATVTTGSGTATCTYTISNLPTVTTGYKCSGLDVTTPADVLVQSVSTVNGCTLTQATKAASDVVLVEVSGV